MKDLFSLGGGKKRREKEGERGKSWEVGKKGRDGETMQDTHPASCLHACGHLLTDSLFLSLSLTHTPAAGIRSACGLPVISFLEVFKSYLMDSAWF